MKTRKFKTNAKCGGCVAKIGTQLSTILPVGQWSIDLDSPDKTLMIISDIDPEEVIRAVEKAGFKAEEI